MAVDEGGIFRRIKGSGLVTEVFDEAKLALGIRFADAGKWNISLAYDGVHFTEQGHRAFAAGLLEVLK